ncbi:ABC transporter ATP-binding protein [Mesoterricola silvestris]|uniref:ABC transporter n=1 Tax=Mesoterricola silvestris TaxID=2927979 RepID=A0AA48K892_9BACT|nr:ATP-binding cassette domain-containing protein [Mesoterricola silvestris]BDU72006.1 ABC transporter [Mesoterricola silvestris]
MPLLEALGVGKRYDARWVLRDLDLAVAPGERVALLGPSGCGKTTLLNLLGGLDRPDEGRTLFRGEDLAAAAPARLARLRRECLGTVFQFFHLVPTLTARENVELPLQLLGWARPALEARVAELMEAVDLGGRASAWPREMSGGEMQRVAVARALAARPALLLADEPTGNLDSASGERVLDLLAALTEREGAALVMVTHSDAAASICHRVVRMKDGRILDGAP